MKLKASTHSPTPIELPRQPGGRGLEPVCVCVCVCACMCVCVCVCVRVCVCVAVTAHPLTIVLHLIADSIEEQHHWAATTQRHTVKNLGDKTHVVHVCICSSNKEHTQQNTCMLTSVCMHVNISMHAC